MKNPYVPVMQGDVQVGVASIDANRLVVSISDKRIQDLIWDKRLLTSVNIYIPGANRVLTIDPINESEGNTNG